MYFYLYLYFTAFKILLYLKYNTYFNIFRCKELTIRKQNIMIDVLIIIRDIIIKMIRITYTRPNHRTL